METGLKIALENYLIGIADDELILAHRDSEWCGHAPIIEEDIAFANIALDEIGHATVWYKIVSELRGEDTTTYPDWLVFSRPADQFRNIQMVELPKGDWAFSILRQYLFDRMEGIRLEAFLKSDFAPLVESASKIRQEEIYHLRHTSLWVKRLAMGTDESHQRMQCALEDLWTYALQMFQPEDHDLYLPRHNLVPDLMELRDGWNKLVLPYLEACGLVIPEEPGMRLQRDQHTKHLPVLISEMQSVASSDPQATW